jgi:hypothetical protein
VEKMTRKINIKDFEARTAQRNQFSAVDTLGSFDFSTAVIYLKSLTNKDIEEAKKVTIEFKPGRNNGQLNFLCGEQYLALAKVNLLAIHEYTHFIDSTSTLWGLRHLSLMSDAYSSTELEKNFYKAKTFFDHIRSIRLPAYYTVINKKLHANRPWGSSLSIGRIFNKDGQFSKQSVLFSRFLNSDGQLIVRSPVSAVSIFEASAMAQETIAGMDLVKLSEPQFKLVEEREFSKKHIDFIYSRELTEYSVCVHILANKIACTDLGVAFNMCSTLTRIALNFPQSLFEKLAEKCPISAVLNISDEHEFMHTIRDGLRSHNMGVVYYLLCNALQPNVVESEDKFKDGLDHAIRSLGIEIDELTSAIETEGENLFRSLQISPIEKIRILASAGYENFKRIHYAQGRLDFSQLNLPPALLGDDTIVSLFNRDTNTLKDFDLEACFFELDDGMSWVNRFSEACL